MLSDCNLMGFRKRIKRSVKLHKYTEGAPPPRRSRGFPLPLWRGVNSLANYSRTVVSVPRPPAPKICSHREDGARRPSSYFKIPSIHFVLGVVITKQQTIVGRWPPCHVLQHPSLLSSLFFIGGHNASQGGRGTEATILLTFAIELLNHSLQGYSLPSIRGGGSRVAARGRGYFLCFCGSIVLWFPN